MSPTPEPIAPPPARDATAPSPGISSSTAAPLPRAVWGLAALAGLITLVFGAAWLQLVADAIRGKALHAYAAAIPAVCVWLWWQRRQEPPPSAGRPLRAWAVAAGLAAILAGVGTTLAWRAGTIEHLNSWLAGHMLAWVLAVWSVLLWFVPAPVLRQHRFAVLFLAFTIPFPEPLVQISEVFLQTSSAAAVEAVLRLVGVPHVRDSREFWLPGLRFVVAQECSGIRSTLVLFITSLLGGHLMLRSAWRKTVLALAVIPLGIARNTFRICTLALLTIHVDSRIINSPLHHQGGPLFFAVALIPLFLLLWWFRRQERITPPPADEKS